MFYKNKFVGNVGNILEDDYREAKSLEELESLIEAIARLQRGMQEFNAPEPLKIVCQNRLMEVTQYYLSMGGTL